MQNYYRRALLLCAVTLATLLSACSSSPQYSWGKYEDLVYQMYRNPDKATPAKQIRQLTEDIARIERKGGYVGPGVLAHLGYMHYLNNNYEQAEFYLKRELDLFPESQVFVQKLLAGITQTSPSEQALQQP